jgi:hypothetical protein
MEIVMLLPVIATAGAVAFIAGIELTERFAAPVQTALRRMRAALAKPAALGAQMPETQTAIVLGS